MSSSIFVKVTFWICLLHNFLMLPHVSDMPPPLRYWFLANCVKLCVQLCMRPCDAACVNCFDDILGCTVIVGTASIRHPRLLTLLRLPSSAPLQTVCSETRNAQSLPNDTLQLGFSVCCTVLPKEQGVWVRLGVRLSNRNFQPPSPWWSPACGAGGVGDLSVWWNWK